MRNEDDNFKITLITVGHTAAGKSTFAQALSEKCDIKYISAGDIKRNFAENYSAKNSLDSHLLDKGYIGATIKAIELLNEQDSVLVDATFFQKNRRVTIESEIRKIFKKSIIVWLYCDCSDYEKVVNRIKKRSAMPENAGNLADDVTVYNYILNNFDTLNIDHFSEYTIIISIDTDKNELKKIESNFNFVHKNIKLLLSVFDFIESYLKDKRNCIN
jgi:adenylate kinase family enzyme